MDKLDLIGITPTNIQTRLTWDEWYQIAENYYKHYGNLEVPRNFKTINGIEPNEKGRNLYNWLLDQARIPAKIRFEYIELQSETSLSGRKITPKELARKKQQFEELITRYQKLIAIDYEKYYEYSRKRKPRKKKISQ